MVVPASVPSSSGRRGSLGDSLMLISNVLDIAFAAIDSKGLTFFEHDDREKQYGIVLLDGHS